MSSTDLPDNQFFLDSRRNNRQNPSNLNGFVTVIIEQIPEWKGFTVEQYFDKYWSLEHEDIDPKLFWLKFSDRHKEDPEMFNLGNRDKVVFGARCLLLDHMLASFADTPEQTGQFFLLMLSITSETVKRLPHENAMLRIHREYKNTEVYHQHLRPHLYEVLRNDKIGNTTSKEFALYILVISRSEVQVYPLLQRLRAHKNPRISGKANGGISMLNRKHPEFSGIYKI